MTKVFVTAGVLLLVAIIIMSFRGGRHQRSGGHSAVDMVKHMERKLDLTEVQKTTILSSLKELEITRNKMNLLHEELEQKMMQQLSNTFFDQEELNRYFESKEREYSTARQQMIANMVAIHTVLTPQQRQKMNKLMASRRAKHTARR
ncbi:MAG: Spy/CpxP family protein refolding chaperone [Flavipsychrobacter sp.]